MYCLKAHLHWCTVSSTTDAAAAAATTTTTTTTTVYSPFSQTTWVSRYHKDKPFWTLLKQRWRWGGSDISGTICKSFAPSSRQITMPTPHHSSFLWARCSTVAQATASKLKANSLYTIKQFTWLCTNCSQQLPLTHIHTRDQVKFGTSLGQIGQNRKN